MSKQYKTTYSDSVSWAGSDNADKMLMAVANFHIITSKGMEVIKYPVYCEWAASWGKAGLVWVFNQMYERTRTSAPGYLLNNTFYPDDTIAKIEFTDINKTCVGDTNV